MSLDHPHAHPPEEDDSPLYVPAEFQADHLEEARRHVARSRGLRHSARRLTATVAATENASVGRRRALRLMAIMHAIAAVFAVVISAIVGAWLVGSFVIALIGVSLGITARVLYALDRAAQRGITAQLEELRRGGRA